MSQQHEAAPPLETDFETDFETEADEEIYEGDANDELKRLERAICSR